MCNNYNWSSPLKICTGYLWSVLLCKSSKWHWRRTEWRPSRKLSACRSIMRPRFVHVGNERALRVARRNARSLRVASRTRNEAIHPMGSFSLSVLHFLYIVLLDTNLPSSPSAVASFLLLANLPSRSDSISSIHHHPDRDSIYRLSILSNDELRCRWNGGECPNNKCANQQARLSFVLFVSVALLVPPPNLSLFLSVFLASSSLQNCKYFFSFPNAKATNWVPAVLADRIISKSVWVHAQFWVKSYARSILFKCKLLVLYRRSFFVWVFPHGSLDNRLCKIIVNLSVEKKNKRFKLFNWLIDDNSIIVRT